MSAILRSAPQGGPISAVEEIRALLQATRVIALVGASLERWRPSHGIMRYLQGVGYRVLPVNPNHGGKTLHGETVYGSLAEADASLGGGQAVDLVNVFRRSEALRGVVEDAIEAGVPAIWTQVGVRDEAAASRAEAAGLTVVMDRCISVEHSRLT